ncbi:unnamed protein product [Pieris macdunnoughi]|uniref:Uncharacterized protein n=1 Tax=Pieris macdunnoughi TaxID=345717 RepID=A0A821RIH4_9NEOP|nr:unnamed protein product [Pieris macdunnoughi]
MLITKYTAILLESAKMSEARNTTPSRSDGDWSSLDSARRKRWRRRTYAYRKYIKVWKSPRGPKPEQKEQLYKEQTQKYMPQEEM